MNVCMYIYIYIYIHIHTHTHTCIVTSSSLSATLTPPVSSWYFPSAPSRLPSPMLSRPPSDIASPASRILLRIRTFRFSLSLTMRRTSCFLPSVRTMSRSATGTRGAWRCASSSSLDSAGSVGTHSAASLRPRLSRTVLLQKALTRIVPNATSPAESQRNALPLEAAFFPLSPDDFTIMLYNIIL